MNKRLEWFLLILLASAGVFLWCWLALPRYQSIDIAINQVKAVSLAQQYLKNQLGIDTTGYRSTAAFNVDEEADRYLQKTLGIRPSQRLLKRLHYDLFFWVVRFFKEKQKEELRVVVSSSNGQITGFSHTIEETAARPLVDQNKARAHALQFLENGFGFEEGQFSLYAENVTKLDHRVEYAFSWQTKDVTIPWSKTKEKGQAKLLTTATVSGGEILNFNRYHFEIPDGFNRYVDNLKQTGSSLILVFRIIYLALLTFAIVVVVNRRFQVVARTVKYFYVIVGMAMFIVIVLDVLNDYPSILFGYPTTQSFGNYVTRQFIENVIGPFFLTVNFILPSLGGESLRFEVDSKRKTAGVLTMLQSSFCSRLVAGQIAVGYAAALILLGLQSVIFNLGYKYCGVWDELSWLAQASTSVFPTFAALAIGIQAAFIEEGMFRLFAINLLRKYGVPTGLAVFLSAAMWGFGHTGYQIFPMWFRGLEVTSIGIVMGIVYLRYGLLATVTAHFLIDASLTALAYLIKPHASFDFYSALSVVFLPLGLGAIAFIFDRKISERPLSIRFNAQQEFNYGLVKQLCQLKSGQEKEDLKKNLTRYGWDAAIIERVFENN